ncbi:hypothetical protein TNCV_4070131 [Trichonephila clavipes]|nr:hypothetical protein TNCV_4070131 [Trichonephila clavipes]
MGPQHAPSHLSFAGHKILPTASLEYYSYGTHNRTLCPVWNVLAPDFSFNIWTLCSSHSLCSLEPFSNHLPRRQCSPLDRLRLLSMGAGTPMSIMTFSQSVVMDPRTNNKQ